MVSVARFFMQFTQNESCGKCVLCREGTKQMLALLDDIIEGRADAETLDLLAQLALAVRKGSLCGLGKTAPNPVLSTLRHFRAEVEAHVFQRRCPAGQCKALRRPEILAELCKGCTVCGGSAPWGPSAANASSRTTSIPRTCIQLRRLRGGLQVPRHRRRVKHRNGKGQDSMEAKPTLTIDNMAVPIDGERNLLDVARKAGIDIPTFCYHSQLSIYGACRLCLVEVEGRGIVASCSTPPEAGLKIRTHTEEIRQMRQIALELILANHEQSCPDLPQGRGLPVAAAHAPPGRGAGAVQADAQAAAGRHARRCRWSAIRTSASSAATACGRATRSRGSARSTSPIAARASCVVPAFGKNLDRGGVRQLRAVRVGLSDRGPDAPPRNRRGLEGPGKSAENGRGANRSGGPRGAGRSVRHGSRARSKSAASWRR